MAETVDPPQRVPNPYGLFSVAEIRDVSAPVLNPDAAGSAGGSVSARGSHELDGVQWLPFACENPHLWEHECPSSAEKCVDCQPQRTRDTDPISVFGSWTCPAVGFSIEEAQERARQNLIIGEQHSVEVAVWSGQFGDHASFVDPATEDLGEASCAAELMSLLHSAADVQFAGNPVFHVPRAAVPWLAQDSQIERVNNRLETPWGVPVAAGTGYTEANVGPDGNAAPEGSFWVYATGPLFVYRGNIIRIPDPGFQGFNTRTNDFTAIAERRFVVGWDCLTVAALFTPSCET